MLRSSPWQTIPNRKAEKRLSRVLQPDGTAMASKLRQAGNIRDEPDRHRTFASPQTS
jgi:hypothetical protein